MQAVVDYPAMTATEVAGTIAFPLPPFSPQALFQMVIPDFSFGLECPITELVQGDTLESITVKVALDTNVLLVLELTGSISVDQSTFRTKKGWLQINHAENDAKAKFIASSLTALIALGGGIRFHIPQVESELVLRFDSPLLSISKILKRRQNAYRLMVIEQSSDIHFTLPDSISSEEVHTIAFVYYAIIERSFVWPRSNVSLPVRATAEDFERVSQLIQLTPVRIRKEDSVSVLFGQHIALGPVIMTISDGFIENAEGVLTELAQGDGHEVSILIRAPHGQVTYEFVHPPRLPETPWESRIQALVNLEKPLDTHLLSRYHALAAATLEGLTEEEKTIVTARTELDAEAFGE